MEVEPPVVVAAEMEVEPPVVAAVNNPDVKAV